jgi:hypothetical protein
VIDGLDLPRATLEALHGTARPLQALALLTGQHPPLDADLAFPTAVAGVAYLVSTAGYLSRRDGLLKPWGWSEQREALRNRTEAALRSSPTPERFLSVLLDRLKVKPEALSTDDRVWWRGFSATTFPTLTRADGSTARPSWLLLRRREVAVDLLTASDLLPGWMTALAAEAKDTGPGRIRAARGLPTTEDLTDLEIVT